MVQSCKGSPHGTTNARAVVGFGAGIPPRAIWVLNLVMSELNIQENPLTQLGMSEDIQSLCFVILFAIQITIWIHFGKAHFVCVCVWHGQNIV